jgi:hypothetical protein
MWAAISLRVSRRGLLGRAALEPFRFLERLTSGRAPSRYGGSPARRRGRRLASRLPALGRAAACGTARVARVVARAGTHSLEEQEHRCARGGALVVDLL